MRKIFICLFTVVLSAIIISCGSSDKKKDAKGSEKSKAKVEKTDSIAKALAIADSITNCGELIHFDEYDMGKIGSIFFNVIRASSDNESSKYIELKKDCGGTYYYSWEYCKIMPEELKYIYKAIERIQSNLNRTTDHCEKYVYITKDKCRIFASSEKSKWTIAFSIDYTSSNSSITLTSEQLQQLLTKFKDCEKKLKQIK